MILKEWLILKTVIEIRTNVNLCDTTIICELKFNSNAVSIIDVTDVTGKSQPKARD